MFPVADLQESSYSKLSFQSKTWFNLGMIRVLTWLTDWMLSSLSWLFVDELESRLRRHWNRKSAENVMIMSHLDLKKLVPLWEERIMEHIINNVVNE